MGFVVWWTSLCWKLQLKENFEKLRHRTAVFFTSMDPTSYVVFFLSLRCHGCMDFKLTAWFDFSLELQTGCQFSWQIWWTCTSLFCWEHRTPWLANFIFLQIFLQGWFRTSWSFWALHFNTCGAHLVNNFSWKGPISLRTINFKLSVWRSPIVTSVWGGIQRRTSKRNFNLRGPRFWLRTSPSRNFGFSTRSNIVKNFWLLLTVLVTWLRRPTEGWTSGWIIRCFQLRMWTIHFYFPTWRKLMETYWRIPHSRSTLARHWLELWKMMK